MEVVGTFPGKGWRCGVRNFAGNSGMLVPWKRRVAQIGTRKCLWKNLGIKVGTSWSRKELDIGARSCYNYVHPNKGAGIMVQYNTSGIHIVTSSGSVRDCKTEMIIPAGKYTMSTFNPNGTKITNTITGKSFFVDAGFVPKNRI
jgi:hypothetical protein